MSDIGRPPFEAEVKERWGDTEAYRESTRRTKNLTKEQLAEIKKELDDIEAGLAEAMAAGAAADGERAMDLAEAARMHIDRRYYPCSPRMHVGLAEMYTADPRFRKHYDDRAAGLAEYVSAAIVANAERQGG